MGAYATGSLGGGISVPYPRTPAAGDLLILWVSVGSTSGKAGANPPTPSGWTMARQGWSGTAAQANIFYRIATGTESGSVAVGAMSGCVEMGRMAEFRGNRTTSAWWGGGGTGIGAATSVTATVTSAGADPSAGNLVVASGSVWLGASSSRTVTNFSSNNAPLTTSQLISTTGWYHYAWGYGSTTANAVADNTTLSVNSAWTNAAMIVGSFNVDPVTPAITLSLPSATTGATFTITPSISTGESGIGSVTYGYWSSGTGWLACATSTNASPVSCTLPGDGSYSIDATVTARNGLSAGYYGLSGARYGITYDHTAPTPTSVAINSGAPYTVSTAVTLTGIAATDTLSGVANMQFSNDAANWSAWQPYAASASWTLSPGDGVKAVYARFQDAYGNGPSNAVSGTIVLDGTPPTAGLAYPEDQRPIAGDVTVTGTASDAIAFASYTLDFGTGSNPSAWTPIATGTTAVPTTAALGIWHTNGLAAGIYTLRLTATDQGGNSPAVATRLVYVDNTRLGQDAFITRVPFDLGGGWSLGVGVEHGDATLGRTLFTIPSYGPEESLSLAYNSQDPTAGAFGTGWSSNFTQYLSFESGFVVWHREDGGRVPFGQVAGTWTPLAGDFERLAAGSGADAGRYIVTQRDQTRLVFEGSGAGRLLRIDNRFGKSLAVTWGSGTATMTDSSGRQTTITFTGSLIVSVIDSALRTWAFGYTGTDLTTVAEPDPDAGGPLASPVTTLTYSGHQLTTVARTRRTAAGGTDTPLWAVGYTGGKATSVVDPIAHKDHADVADTFAYSAGNTVVSLLRTYSPGLRNNTTYSYDGSGRVTSQLDPGGYATTYHYDFDQPGGNSLLTSVDRPIDASTTATTSYSYDAVGNILTETRPLTSPTDTVTTVMTYNASNDLVTRSEADGDPALQTVTLNTYSGGHLVTVVRNCTSAGTTPPSPASSCTAAGTHDASTNLTTSYTYTANGQVDTETDPLGRVTKHAYDQFGNETSVTGNYVAGQGQTPDQNVTTSYTYPQVAGSPGLLGLATSQTDPTGAVTTYGYDILGRRTSEVDPADATISALTKATTYDELGNVLTETDSWPAIGLTAAGSRLTTAVYDLANRPTSVTDSAGSTTRQYDAAGEETQTVSAGVATGRVFDGLGNLVTETTGTGGTAATTTRTFDAQGHELTTTVNSATTTRTFDYAGRPLTETVDGSTTTHQYDKLGHEITTADPTGGTTTTAYDRVGRVTRVTAPTGEKTDTVHDAAGNAIAVTHPYTGTAFTAIDATTFDALNRAVVAIVNCTTTGTTPPADPSTCTGAGTHDAATNLTTRTAYDAAGHTLAVLDAKGITTRTFVNARGQTTETLVNCTDSGTTPPGDPAWRTCAGLGTHDKATNQETDTTYDGSGAVFSSVQTIKSGVGPDTSPTSYAAYDGAGRQIAARDARGAVTITAYDASGRVASTTVNCTDSGTSQPAGPPSPAWITCAGAGTHDASANLVTSYTYDSRGNKATATAPNGKLTTYSYDDANHLIKVIDNDVPSPSTPDQDVTTEYHYDAAGRQDAVKGPTGTVSINVYDTTTGRLTKAVVNCLDSPPPTSWWACSGNGTKDWQTNLTTSYTYDAAGRKVSETKPDPSAPQSGTGWDATVTTRYAYNETGQLCRVLEVASVDLQALAVPCTTPVSGTTSTNLSTQYAYDDAGNLATMIDASGHTTSYGYDKAGHMTSLTDADGATQWGYDNAGNRISQTNRTPGSTITWTYDSSGRMTTRLADGTTVTYGYDLDGNRTSAGDGTRTVSSTYDPLNRPLAVTTSDDPGAGTTYTYSFTSPSWADPTGAYLAALDPMGWQTGLTEPAHPGSPFTFTYRADGQPATVTAPSTTADTTTYAYDAAGRLSSKTTTRGGPSIASYAWTVNAAGNRRAESSTITGDPANGSTAFAYDQAGRLTGYTPPAGLASQAYGWDRVPNRTSLTVGTNPAITTAFDAANRPQADTPGGAYATDLDGRVTGIPAQGGVAARSLAHDSLGRLTSVVVGGITRSYAYDPLDRLYSVSTGGVTTERFRYVGLTSSMAQTLDGSGAVTRSFGTDWSGAHLLDWTGTGSDVRFYGTNGHGDLAWTADSTGAPTAMLHYDPYGTLVASTGTSLPDVRFQGSWADDTTKLSWANARWYAPSMGTFLTEDSLLGQTTEPSSRQLYAYGAGDPVDRVDPGGQFWFLTTIGSTNLVRLSSIYYGNVLFTDRLRTANNLSGWFVEPGRCIWIPGVNRPDQCRPPKSNVIRYAPSLINYRWSVSRSTPMVQANMGPIFVRAYGVYVLTVGQGSPKIPSITASTTGLGISNSVSTFQISPTGQVVMMGGAPIRIAGWRGATGPGQSLPGSAHTVEGWHAVNALYGLGFCPEVCYQWETRWSRELYLDGVYFGTPMYVKADVRLHVNMGYEFWSYPAAPAAAFALATSWQFLAGLSLVLPMLQPALSR